MLQEIVKSLVAVFSLSGKQTLSGQNPAMTTCLISAFFLGTSVAHAVAADDLVEQCPSAVPESVCKPHPATMQQHIDKGAVTSGREKGEI